MFRVSEMVPLMRPSSTLLTFAGGPPAPMNPPCPGLMPTAKAALSSRILLRLTSRPDLKLHLRRVLEWSLKQVHRLEARCLHSTLGKRNFPVVTDSTREHDRAIGLVEMDRVAGKRSLSRDSIKLRLTRTATSNTTVR
jgi:hypothetical protein